MNDSTPEPKKLFPLIITESFEATRAFYVDRLGVEITFDLPNYLQVRFGGPASSPELAFMRFGPNSPVPQPAFQGGGVVISVPVPSADAHARHLRDRGVEILEGPTDRPWEWRSFSVRDPAGVVLDFFHPLHQG